MPSDRYPTPAKPKTNKTTSLGHCISNKTIEARTEAVGGGPELGQAETGGDGEKAGT
ncbi:hypothetical protein F2Q70_00023059 [Brassica cretica]|uniref:Uncharacterized protein n=1 Tax=Brassica cretica TaxID=69181 RepID=A0A8S9GYS6_BRACR|nr:hypothetical protein F2Q70_00023059 [Brassica cretica]